MKSRTFLVNVLCLYFIIFVSACSNSSDSSNTNNPRSGQTVDYVLQCHTECSALAAKITELGGTIKHRYRNVNALLISITADNIPRIQSLSEVKAVEKDRLVHAPIPQEQQKMGFADSAQIKSLTGTDLSGLISAAPANYSFNNGLTGASVLHEAGHTGKDVIVAVIDTGTANNAELVPALAGSVIGGENFVMAEGEPSATSTLNNPHGTWIGGMIASHIGVVVPTEHAMVQALLAHAPDSVLPNDETTSLIPVMGSAPEASLYAMKVFPASGAGAPASIVMKAMDRIITLKENYNDDQENKIDAGDGSEDNPFVYEALNIQVVNMSLGGPSLFPGLDVEDILTRKMLKEGITVVTAAGNSGAAALTTSSPSTGVGSLSVGAANSPAHERILVDLLFGPGSGVEFRANDIMQIAQFSSRGPVPDGRQGVHIVANGVASFTQGTDGEFSLVSGTSLSSPTIAGAAALLWGAKPDADAEDVRKALMMSADPEIIGDMVMGIDQGNGFVSIPAALDALMDGPNASIPKLPEPGDGPVMLKDTIAQQDLSPVMFTDGEFSMMLDLAPGQVKHFFVPVMEDTMQLNVSIMDVMPALPAEEQNPLFGDDIFLTIIDAPTTINDVFIETFVNADEMFEIKHPQHGLVRVAVMGDWTNAGMVSSKIMIKEMKKELTPPGESGSLRDEDIDVFEVEVEDPSITELKFELSWNSNWGSYPTHDIDLYVVDPMDNIIFDGATFRSPERVMITEPMQGEWKVIVEGFALHGFRDRYRLRVTDQDNNPVKIDD